MKVNIISEMGVIRDFDFVDGSFDYTSLLTVTKENFPHIKRYALLWKDSDGDKITLSSQEELNEAVTYRTEEELDIYITEISDEISSRLYRTDEEIGLDIDDSITHHNAHQTNPRWDRRKCYKRIKAVTEKTPDNLPDFFSISKVPCRIKRRLKRSDRKCLRHRIRASSCYPRQKHGGRKRLRDVNKSLENMSIS
ncbi:uncharacterized protein LOC133171543 [Saccostrea echinata]|uniref:uncharacterized protein LOC133171543 n=1 Tax=Saccostrea echinata TaxID=191078 RepID=UPI002A7ED355|nr:uncharacterized protein LOC133171543 [Saccostrea echinata]